MSVAPVVAQRRKPTATATITPMSRRAAAVRNHLIELVVNLSDDDTKYGDEEYVAGVAREALSAFPSALWGPSRRSIDASVVSQGRPADDRVDQLRRVLEDAGYRLVVRERRECAEPTCETGAMIDWNRLSQVPPGWFSNLLCGAHHYRQCSCCRSTYRMSSTNAVDPAPSVRCQVCGLMMVEWGGSKIWEAELVTAGT
jgi:hypothetical protein